jgi:hypothetical protein
MSQPLPLSDAEIANGKSYLAAPSNRELRMHRSDFARLYATIEARDRENAALAAKLANIRKLCDENGCCCDCGRATIHRHEILAIIDAKPGVEET